MRRTDWVAWHGVYDDPDSEPSRRLPLIQAQLRAVLELQPPGPIRVVIPCAGQGRGLLGVLADHPRRADVVATLVDIDPANVEIAQSTARELALPGITAVVGDAGRAKVYARAVPASVVVLAGFFTYLSERDVSRLIAALPRLCARDATVIWSRRANARKRTVPTTREQFETAGFREVPTDITDPPNVHVGVEHFAGTPLPLQTNARLFRFRDPQRLTNRTFGRVRRSVASRMTRRPD
jgi:hypothetical protein